jgi:hypothetical protein
VAGARPPDESAFEVKEETRTTAAPFPLGRDEGERCVAVHTTAAISSAWLTIFAVTAIKSSLNTTSAISLPIGKSIGPPDKQQPHLKPTY